MLFLGASVDSTFQQLVYDSKGVLQLILVAKWKQRNLGKTWKDIERHAIPWEC